MSPRAHGRTRPCTKAASDGRRAKALEFWQAACDLDSLHPEDATDAYIQLCVLAGIAAADVICCVRLGEHADDQSHVAAVSLLKKIDPDLASGLSRLLRLKTQSGYRSTSSTTKQKLVAGRAAELLVDAARAAR